MNLGSAVVVPSASGRAALDDLERVAWVDLGHAYGIGKLGPALHHDVAAALRALCDANPDAAMAGAEALFSSVCHQGTIYEASAYAVPFLCAIVADPTLPAKRARAVALLVGGIAVASSSTTDDGCRAGASGENVAATTRQAFRASAEHITAAGLVHPHLRALTAAITASMQDDDPSEDAIARVSELVEALEDEESGGCPDAPGS